MFTKVTDVYPLTVLNLKVDSRVYYSTSTPGNNKLYSIE